LPEFPGFEVGRAYEPGSGLMAGDFYDLYQTGPERLAAVIGDVSGHGIDASITAFQVKYLLRVFLRQYRDPAQAVEELNAVLSAQNRGDEFVSLCVTVFDESAGTLRFSSAGHLPAWLWHDGELRGNLDSQGEKLARQHKLFVRDRLALLLDEATFVEDALLANANVDDLPADGVVTGTGHIGGRPVCVMANDPTVKAGSWGARTVEKIVRLTEYALRHELPVFWLVDSAGARITDQVQLFPGRRGAGRIFYNQVRLSGKVPQICCLFGPSAAGGAYIPAFCDVVIMVEGNASMY